MISFSVSSKTSRRVLLTATAILLFGGAQGGVARGGGNSGNHGGMRGHDLNAHEGMMRQESHRDRDRGDGAGSNTIRPIVTSRRHQNYGKHGDESHDYTPTTRKGTEKHAKSPVECIRAPCSLDGGDRDAGHGHEQAGDGIGSKPPAVPGTAGNNTIHPIVTSNPAAPADNTPSAAGKLPPNDPVGNTRPTLGQNAPAPVTVSNCVTTTQIQNGLGGVSV